MINHIFTTLLAASLSLIGIGPCTMPDATPTHCYTTNDETLSSGIADIFF